MRKPFILIIALSAVACQRNTDLVGDIEAMVNNHLENNAIEIERIRKELKINRIDTLSSNIKLVERLTLTHTELVALNDSLARLTPAMALEKTRIFIGNHFQYGTDLFTQKDLGITVQMDASLLKLHLARLETLLIYGARADYDFGGAIRFDKIVAIVLPDKAFLRKGDKLSGRVFLGAMSTSAESNNQIRKVLVNGHEATYGDEGWAFEFVPTAKGAGVMTYELNAEITLKDGTCEGRGVVCIEN